MDTAMKIARAAAFGMLGLCTLAMTPAFAAGQHVHGQAVLHVGVDGNRLLLEFTSPLDNLVGFEHAPRNDKQAAAVRAMAARLHQPAGLFVPTRDAMCVPGPVRIESSVLAPDLLAANAPVATPLQRAPAAAPERGAGHDTHAALLAEIAYSCEHPGKLTSLELPIFDAFPRLRRIDAQVAGARKQAAARLTARQRRLSW